jgi:hypothetical protein
MAGVGRLLRGRPLASRMLPWVDVLLQKGGGSGGPGTLAMIVWIVVLIIDVLILIAVWKSRKTTGVKIVWTIVILLTSIIGWVLYFFLGREK